MSEYDLAAYVERPRKRPCFVCAHLGGHPGYRHVPIHADAHVVGTARPPQPRPCTAIEPVRAFLKVGAYLI
jgi:hypothetical protein